MLVEKVQIALLKIEDSIKDSIAMVTEVLAIIDIIETSEVTETNFKGDPRDMIIMIEDHPELMI